MTPPSNPTPRPLRSQVPQALACLLIIFAAHPLGAQSESSMKSNAAAAKAAAAPAATDPFIMTPSRRVTPEDLTKYVQTIGLALSISGRETDPFGQLQDPDAKPIIKPTIASPKRVAPMQATPFSDIVSLIRVTTIMPGERSFLIGNRSVKQGDRIPLAFRGKSISVEVESVSSNRIRFRKCDNNETADLTLNMLPPGMKPGQDGIRAPGMVPDNPNAPIDLDESSLPLNAAQNIR